MGEGRWMVELDDHAGTLFRSENVHAIEDLSIGARVILENMTEPARIPFNGHGGTITGWDYNDNRWQVLATDGSSLLLKACSLQMAQVRRNHHGLIIFLQDLQDRADLNGACGKIGDWNDKEQRFQVRLEHGEEFGFKPANLTLAPARRTADISPALDVTIEVQHLQNRPELNGLLGKVVGWDDIHQRWHVMLEGDQAMALRPGSLRLTGLKGESAAEILTIPF